MTADALAPCFARSSAAMILAMWNRLAFHEEGFQLPVSCQCGGLTKNVNICFCSLSKIQHAKGSGNCLAPVRCQAITWTSAFNELDTRNKFQWNFTLKTTIFIQESVTTYIANKMPSILFRPRCGPHCVNMQAYQLSFSWTLNAPRLTWLVWRLPAPL